VAFRQFVGKQENNQIAGSFNFPDSQSTLPRIRLVVRGMAASSSFTVVFPEYDDPYYCRGNLRECEVPSRRHSRSLQRVPVNEIGHALRPASSFDEVVTFEMQVRLACIAGSRPMSATTWPRRTRSPSFTRQTSRLQMHVISKLTRHPGRA